MNFVCTARKEIALPGFVDIRPTLVNGTSIERCSRVLVYYRFESLKFKKLNLKKKIEIDEIEFCPLQNVTRVSIPRRNPRIRILTCSYLDLVGQRAEIVTISARPTQTI